VRVRLAAVMSLLADIENVARPSRKSIFRVRPTLSYVARIS
jgi:hypothetical protein